MRQFLPIALSLLLVRFQFAQIESATGVVARGTGVEIELLESVSSESLHAGQNVPFKLVRPLEANGVALLAAGTPFNGKVTKVDAAGHWGKAGAFDLTLEPLKLADGTLVHVDFHRPPRLNARREKVDENTETGIAMMYYFPLMPAVALIAGSRERQALQDSRGGALPGLRYGHGSRPRSYGAAEAVVSFSSTRNSAAVQPVCHT